MHPPHFNWNLDLRSLKAKGCEPAKLRQLCQRSFYLDSEYRLSQVPPPEPADADIAKAAVASHARGPGKSSRVSE